MGEKMSFDFSSPSRILFGKGFINKLPELGKENGKKPFVVTGSGKANADLLFDQINSTPQDYVHWVVKGEPSVEDIRLAVETARKESCDYVIGFGGGSVIDSGKAVAAMLTNSGEILDYLEVVGKNLPLRNLSAPYIAIPTTAGTGSEVTRNAVLTVSEKHVKISMRSPLMVPKIAIIDPLLTCSVPPEVTASTGMDALTQVIEPFVSLKRNELTDLFCREGIKRGAKSLICAYLNGDDHEAREDMCWVSLLGGLSLANAGLGMVHGFAGPIGGMFHAPHGAICASLLPSVVEINIKALMARDSNSKTLSRYSEIASILSGKDNAEIGEAWIFLKNLCSDLKIPGLRSFGVKQQYFDEIVGSAQNASSTKGNPIVLNREELITILEMAF
jgi:alcohol dehydrogenase class IV